MRQSLYRLLFCSLNTQEVSMRVQSIWTAIQIRHPARNRFFRLARQVPLGEVHGIAELHHVMQKVRPVAETLQYPRHLRAPGMVDVDLDDLLKAPSEAQEEKAAS